MNLIPSEPGPPACIVVRVLATRQKERVRIPIQASVFVVVLSAPVQKTTIAPIINQSTNQPSELDYHKLIFKGDYALYF